MLHLFQRRAAPAQDAAPPREFSDFERAMQHTCEIRAMDDRPVFLGRAQDYDGGTVRIFSALGKDVPPVIYNNQYKLVFRAPTRPAPVWTGRIAGSTDDFWKLDQLERFRDEQRDGFRQRVAQPASVLPLERAQLEETPLSPEDLSRAHPCQVVDMSLGGLQLLCYGLRLRVGDEVAVTRLRLTHDPQPFTLPLQVRWAVEGKDETLRCGCRFRNLDQRDENRLCAAIFELQRTSLAYR